MHFEPDHIYHVYNRGNNRIKIFFTPANYLFLLRKVRNEWLSYADILAYCLMPNHFHFMLHAKPEGCKRILQLGEASHLQVLSKVIGKTLSSYTQAINIQNNKLGTLFQKKTKAKWLTDPSLDTEVFSSNDYLTNCFGYIHNNPRKARIVQNLQDWPYSSWLDYYGFRNGTLCNKALALERIGISKLDLSLSKEIHINKEIIKRIW